MWQLLAIAGEEYTAITENLHTFLVSGTVTFLVSGTDNANNLIIRFNK